MVVVRIAPIVPITRTRLMPPLQGFLSNWSLSQPHIWARRPLVGSTSSGKEIRIGCS